MRKIREVLRLRFENNLSYRDIASSCRMGRSTVGEYLRRAETAGVTWLKAQQLDDEELETLLFPVPVVPGRERPLPDWDYVRIPRDSAGCSRVIRPLVPLLCGHLFQVFSAALPVGGWRGELTFAVFGVACQCASGFAHAVAV